MSVYSFSLQIKGIESADYDSRLFEAGCDDALVAIIDGALVVDFDREASSYENAINSAKANIKRAGGEVVRVIEIPRLHD